MSGGHSLLDTVYCLQPTEWIGCYSIIVVWQIVALRILLLPQHSATPMQWIAVRSSSYGPGPTDGVGLSPAVGHIKWNFIHCGGSTSVLPGLLAGISFCCMILPVYCHYLTVSNGSNALQSIPAPIKMHQLNAIRCFQVFEVSSSTKLQLLIRCSCLLSACLSDL